MTELNFADPPIHEVSFSAQFEPINELHIGYIGLIWGLYKDNYPFAEHLEELPHQVEKFGVIQREIPKLQFLEKFPPPRMRITSKEGDAIIQVQKDRFVFNWRKNSTLSNEYPRYKALKSKFLDELNRFTEFLEFHNLPSLEFNQIEFAYVNHIDATNHSMQTVFNDIGQESKYSNELELESFSIKFKHIINHLDEKIGRLYTSIDKGNRILDNSSIYILSFTARSHLLDSTLSGLTDIMDILRSQINSSFNAITTDDMHAHWNKEEE